MSLWKNVCIVCVFMGSMGGIPVKDNHIYGKQNQYVSVNISHGQSGVG